MSLSDPLNPAGTAFASFFPTGTSWASVNDFIYKLLIDKYFIRFWDMCGLSIALTCGIGYYLVYWFQVQLAQTALI